MSEDILESVEQAEQEASAAVEEQSEQRIAREDLDKAIQQKQKWREEAQKAQEELQRLKAQSQTKEDSASGSPGVTRDDLERIRLENKGLTDDAIDFVMNHSKGSGKSVQDVLQDDFVKNAIGSMEQKQQSESATPAPSARVPQQAETPREFTGLSDAEARQSWADRVDAHVAAKKK